MPSGSAVDKYRYTLLILLEVKFFFRSDKALPLSHFWKDKADTFVDVDKDVFKNVDGIFYIEKYEASGKVYKSVMIKRIECSNKKNRTRNKSG